MRLFLTVLYTRHTIITTLFIHTSHYYNYFIYTHVTLLELLYLYTRHTIRTTLFIHTSHY